ncbi:MAG: helix-turn-helix domain-containing protein [Bacteroidota bacterium]
MESKLLFFFSALGVFNSLVLSAYFLFFKKNSSTRDYLTGALLLLFTVRVGVSCFYFFESVPVFLIYAGMAANLLLGPTLYYLCRSFQEKEFRFGRPELFHYLIISSVILITSFLFPFKTWDWTIRFFLHGLLTAYLGYIALKWHKLFTNTLFSGEKADKSQKKITLIYLASVLVCLGFAVSLLISYIAGPLLYSLIFYGTIALYFKIAKSEALNYQHNKIDDKQFNTVNSQLTALMEVERIYKNPDLKLDTLAAQLKINKHLLSQLLNNNLSKSFYQYINEYRVHEACNQLKENSTYSVEAIGYEVGFNSRSAFFSSFKKITGKTPSEYRKHFSTVK